MSEKVVVALGVTVTINQDIEEVWKVIGNFKNITWLVGEEWNKQTVYKGELGVGCTRKFGEYEEEEVFSYDPKNHTLVYGTRTTLLVILHLDNHLDKTKTRCRWTVQVETEKEKEEEKRKQFSGFGEMFIKGFKALEK